MRYRHGYSDRRRRVFFPPTQRNNAMVVYYSAIGTIAEVAVDATSGQVELLNHHTILECGNMLVPELVSGQLQGGLAMGIGLALHEYMPLYEDGPGNGTWNFNRYTCRAAATWRCGSRPPKSCRRCPTASRPRAWPRW